MLTQHPRTIGAGIDPEYPHHDGQQTDEKPIPDGREQTGFTQAFHDTRQLQADENEHHAIEEKNQDIPHALRL
jgi:hypothetical protein